MQSRLIISGLSGGSGKTFVSLGLARALYDKGLVVQTFKKGPDYIDSKFLELASHRLCTNLDPFFLSEKQLIQLYNYRTQDSDIAIIEGNRGLFDGRDLHGTASTARLAKTLEAPVILAVNCSKSTRTLAAILLGIKNFDKNINIAGIILNNLGSARHQTSAIQAIEYFTDIPVLGAIPRLEKNPILERHMGLILNKKIEPAIQHIANIIQDNCNLDAIIEIAKNAKKIKSTPALFTNKAKKKFKQGVVNDACLWFYYPENLAALEAEGAELVNLSLFAKKWPSIDALYLGGGFPESYAKRLAKAPILKHIKKLAADNLPIYAECGGLVILGKDLEVKNQIYPMANVFNFSTKLEKKPQGLGYVEAKVKQAIPYFKNIEEFKGHEFHYTKASNVENTCLELSYGQGLGQKKDGLLYKNCYASYTHLFALAVPNWAKNFASLALNNQEKKLDLKEKK